MGDSGFGQFLSFVGMGIALIAGPAGWGAYGVIAGMAISAAGGMMTQTEMRRDADEALRKAREAMAGLRVNARTQLKAIQVLYGRARVGGNVIYMKTSGENNRDLHTIWGVGEGPIDAFEQVWFDDVLVYDVGKIGTNSGHLETPYKGWFDFEPRLGTNGQTAFSRVTSIDSDFSDRYPMTAVAYLKFRYSPEIYQGVPTVNFVVRGRILNRPWDAGSGWTDSPPLIIYDQMTHPRYGLGVSTTAVNCASWLAANSYSQEPPTIIDPWIEQTIDQVAFGPKQYSETIPYHSIVASAGTWIGFTGNVGGTDSVKLPIRPGSLMISGSILTVDNGEQGYTYTDVSTGGINATAGTIVDSAGTTVGSVNYLTGEIGLPAIPPDVGGSPMAQWFGGYGVYFRTTYQYLARSVSLTCGSETLVETGTITNTGYLISSQGGWGLVDYTNGIVEARLAGADWYDFPSATVRYKTGTLSNHRFAFNGGYVNASPVLDQVRDVLSHMRGFLVDAGGEYKLKTEGPGASIYSFDDDNIVAGSFRVVLPSLKDRPNRIRVKYIDALEAYTPKDALYEVGSPADIESGLDREYTMVLPGCVYRDQAHRIAQTVANAAALGIGCSFETNAAAADLEPGDIVDVTHPSCAWVEKLFRVWYVGPGNNEQVEIRAFEHDDSTYVENWPFGDMVAMKASAYPRRSYFAPDVTSLSLSVAKQILSDGTISPGIRMRVEATSGAMAPAGYRFIAMYESASSAPIVAYEGKNPEFIWGPALPGIYNVSAYSISDFGIQGTVGKSRSIAIPVYDFVNRRYAISELPKNVFDFHLPIYQSKEFCWDGRFISLVMSVGDALGFGKSYDASSALLPVRATWTTSVGESFNSTGRCLRHYYGTGSRVNAVWAVGKFVSESQTDYLLRIGVLDASSLSWVCSATVVASNSKLYGYYDPYISQTDADGQAWVTFFGGASVGIAAQKVWVYSGTRAGSLQTIVSSFDGLGVTSATSYPWEQVMGVAFEPGSAMHFLFSLHTTIAGVEKHKYQLVTANWSGTVISSPSTILDWSTNFYSDATFFRTGVSSPDDKAFAMSRVIGGSGVCHLEASMVSINRRAIVYDQAQMWDFSYFRVNTLYGSVMDHAWADGSPGHRGIIPFALARYDEDVADLVPWLGSFSFLTGSPAQI